MVGTALCGRWKRLIVLGGTLAATGLAERCGVEGGDMQHAVPQAFHHAEYSRPASPRFAVGI
jgi:hypothetical protein